MVMQTKLDKLRHRFHVLHFISMRVPEMRELPLQAYREFGEIAFPTVALECEVRLPLALFIRRLLNEFPLHPFQVALALWKQCLAICILWHRLRDQDPNYKELQSCFRVR